MSQATEVIVGITVELFLATLAIGLLYCVRGRIFAIPQRRVVLPFQKGVVLQSGSVEKVLDSGSYWITPKRTLVLCDMRPTPFQIASLELLTADAMAVRVSLGGEYRILNPIPFVTASTDPFEAFYLEIRQALHAAVHKVDSDAFLKGNSLVINRVKELLIPRAVQLGVEMTQLEVWEAAPVGWLRSV